MGKTINFDPRDILPYRNLIRNGGFDIWQRSTLKNFTAASGYAADRFLFGNSLAAATLRVERRTDFLPNSLLPYNCMMEVASGAGSFGVADNSSMEYRMEGYDWAQLVDSPFTFFFYLRSTRLATLGFAARLFLGPTRSFVKELVITQVNTWLPFIVVVPKAPPGAHNLSNGEGIRFNLTLLSGSTFVTSSVNQWTTGEFIAGPNQTFFLQNTNDSLRVSQMMCVRGDFGDQFLEFSRFGYNQDGELRACQRYYEKSYSVDTPDQTATSDGAILFQQFNTHLIPIFFKAQKRSTPLVGIRSPITGATGVVRDASTSTDIGVGVGQVSDWGIGQISTNVGANNHTLSWHFTADAEL